MATSDRSGELGTSATQTDRSVVIARGVEATATWSLRLIIIGVASFLLFWLLGQIWVGVRPILLALIVSTVLRPPVAWLRRRGWPAGLATATVLLTGLVLLVGALAISARLILTQATDLAEQAAEGLQQLQQWLSGPPLNLANEQINSLTTAAADQLRSSGSQIATGVVSGVSAVGSTVVTAVLVLVLTFFFVKDGPRFLPWLRREAGRSIGEHLTEVCTRCWRTLGSFIQVQAFVSFVDAVFIGLGLVLLQVPLAPVLALLTFIAGFVPIVGAITAGALAVLVALVSNGLVTAVLVLALILLVQQLESNVLQPVLQGRSLRLHAAVVLLVVTAGGTLFGIIGAFLAVPVAAVTATCLRYLDEQVALRAGEINADDVAATTPEGVLTARRGEDNALGFLRLRSRRRDAAQDESR